MTKAPKLLEGDPEGFENLVGVVGVRLRAARRKANLTQVQLGEISGFKDSYIAELESGSNVTLKTLIRIASALNLQVADLLPDSGSAQVSSDGLERLNDLLGRLVGMFADRQARDAEMLKELKEFANLRLAVENALKTLHTPGEPKTSVPTIRGSPSAKSPPGKKS